jgi:ribosomal subunit interface protein
MPVPMQITFRDMEPSAAIEERIRERAAQLERFADRITHCHVVVQAPHHHHHQGVLYEVHVDLTVPGAHVVVNRQPTKKHAHEDIYVAVRDAFDAARRQLEDHVRRQRGDVKTHAPREEGC